MEQLREQIRILLLEKAERAPKRHLTVPEAARIYGYTQEEIRRLAIDEGKLRFIPVGKARGAGYRKTRRKNAYQRIKFDRNMLEEDFVDLMICAKARKEALAAKARPQKTYVNPNKHRYLPVK